MEIKQKIRTIILGFIAVVITLVIGIVFAQDGTLRHLRFWSVMGPLIASEIFLTICLCGLFGKTRQASFPVRIAASVIPWAYFGFTLCMVLIYRFTPLSANVILTVQIIVMFLALVAFVAVEMASDAVQGHAVATAASNASRMSYRVTVEGVLETLRGRFGGDKDMGKLFDQLYDAARYACDSVPGAEKIEAELEEKLMRLESSAGTDDAENIKSAILQILSAFRRRESIIKALR